jgi:gluconate 5-dehydrogenase
VTDLFDIRGKTILITGASYGLGEVFAKSLADAGADLVVTARSTDLLEKVAAECRERGSKVTAVTGDVSNETDVGRVVEAGIAEHGRIDVLLNNAGLADLRGLPAEQFDSETFRRIVEVDMVGAFLMARAVGRHMLQQGGGSIINVCSIMANGANEMNVIGYTAAKGGLLNLTYQLGCEWADRGVRVNALSPGFIVTAMTAPGIEALGIDEYVASRTPMRRVGRADELIGAVIFLASDASSYVTGLDLRVDGGTNAANGYFQVPPAHHEWGPKLGAPMIGQPYQGLASLPESLDLARQGIPGIHFPAPGSDSGE